MIRDKSAQELLFQAVRQQIPPNISFVHDISGLLGISYDSAYRRIRGDKELSLEEVSLICRHFNISVDPFLGLTHNHVVFTALAMNQNNITIPSWLEMILGELNKIKLARNREIIYAARDIPIFHLFQFPEIAAFKFFFWKKALFFSQNDKEPQFSLRAGDYIRTTGCELLSVYNSLAVTELWNEETFTSLTRQIEYCYASGFFSSKETVRNLCDVLDKLVNHLQRQAGLGYLFMHDEPEEGTPGDYRLYFNDIVMNDNTIYVSLDGKPSTYMTCNIIDLLVTGDTRFCGQIRDNQGILMSRSTLISGKPAKTNKRFFRHMYDRVKFLRSRIV